MKNEILIQLLRMLEQKLTSELNHLQNAFNCRQDEVPLLTKRLKQCKVYIQLLELEE